MPFQVCSLSECDCVGETVTCTCDEDSSFQVKPVMQSYWFNAFWCEGLRAGNNLILFHKLLGTSKNRSRMYFLLNQMGLTYCVFGAHWVRIFLTKTRYRLVKPWLIFLPSYESTLSMICCWHNNGDSEGSLRKRVIEEIVADTLQKKERAFSSIFQW